VKGTILVADDDPVTQTALQHNLEKQGFDVIVCGDGHQALETVGQQSVDLIIADYEMPRMDGLALLKNLKTDGIDIPFVIITSHGSVDSTMEAIRLGAVEYLTKPFDMAEILIVLQKALNVGELKKRISQLNDQVTRRYHFDNIIGQSVGMQSIFELIHKASRSTANVLIEGESGTGKELAARAIHYNGLQRSGPFIAVNCSAFSKGTLESELFGHVKGAFTDAHRDHKGRFELADQGALFLDEVGDIPLGVQVKLLRVLQEKQFERVGDQETIRSDFRLIAATNQNLKKRVQEGRFREDLYYRLSVINLSMPPLREHPEDIPLLIKHFLTQYSRANQKDVKTLSMEALQLMQQYVWPGNVRQLENVIESAVVLCEGNMIRMSDLPLELHELPSESPGDSELLTGSLPEVVSRIEIQMIRRALRKNGWVKARAAKTLGVNERVLSYKMNKYSIEKE
jgi:two-component system NtrC family response regulator